MQNETTRLKSTGVAINDSGASSGIHNVTINNNGTSNGINGVAINNRIACIDIIIGVAIYGGGTSQINIVSINDGGSCIMTVAPTVE